MDDEKEERETDSSDSDNDDDDDANQDELLRQIKEVRDRVRRVAAYL